MLLWAASIGLIANIAVDLIYLGLVIGTIIVVIRDSNNPFKTMSWILVLIFLPIVGLILYLFFGQNQRRLRIISERSYKKLVQRPAYAVPQPVLQKECLQKYSGQIGLLQKLSHAPLSDGNKVTPFTSGYAYFAQFIKDLYGAKKYIHIESYIFMDDALGSLIRDILVQKAGEGVQIKVIYDDVGSWKVHAKFMDTLLSAGIEVRAFLRVRFPLFTSRVNYRNHRKIAIIDGDIGYIGGINIADRYVKGVPWGVWRDTHLKITGKAVWDLQTAFILDWYFVDQSMIYSPELYPAIGREGDSCIQVVASNPVDPWKNIMQGLVKAIMGAQKYFYIQTPYFLPTESILETLKTAALSGVDVRLMLPEKSDTFFTFYGARSYLDALLEAGVKVYLYQKGFLHAKMMVADDDFYTVGSTNMDFRSFELNFEINAFVYDAKGAEKMRDIFMVDQKDSRQIQLKEWRQRPLRQRFLENLIRLFAPLL